MAKNKKDPKAEKTAVQDLRNSMTSLNSLARKVLGFANSRNNGERDGERDLLRQDIETVIRRDLSEFSDLEGKDLSTLLARFIMKESKVSQTNGPLNKFDIEDIFENESNGILTQFQERYKNVNLQYEDLHIIKKQVRELTTAINVTRNAILSSDDITASISRAISFGKGDISEEDLAVYLAEVSRVEEELDIARKIKNHVVTNSLTFGNYFVYTVPYADIFSKELHRKLKDNSSVKRISESFTESDLVSVLENHNLAEEKNKEKVKDYIETANDLLGSISVTNENIPLPLLEGGLSSMYESLTENDLEKMMKKAEKDSNVKGEAVRDAIYDNSELEKKGGEFDFSEFSGCHVQLIDPRKIIPVKILNKIIGYYYIHEEQSKRVRSPFTTNFNVDVANNAKEVESDFILKITERIVKEFDKEFLEKNVEFKDTILNSIIYHNIYNKNIKFQFIPAEYITEFPVNLDENGNGQSILIDALFYAKLYLALLIFKMISIISRSNDQRLYYVRTSGMDKDVTNAVQDIVRQMKMREVNFNDLLNYKSIVSKVGAGRDIYMPVGPDDLRGIDFETLGGQDIQLNTELMEQLKTSAINATDVPSVITEYLSQVDFARTLEMANARYANTVADYQIDYNGSITQLYRKMLLYSGANIPPEVIATLTYKLTVPTSLQATNANALMSEISQEIDFILKAKFGTNFNPGEIENAAMDIMTERIAKQRIGSIRWEAIDSAMEEVMIEAKKRIEERKQNEKEE